MGILTQPTNIANPLANKVWYNYMPKQSSTFSGSWGTPTSMIYANGTYAFVTDSGVVFYSTDGKNWNYQRPTTNGLYGIAFGNGTWVIVGDSNTCLSTTNIAGAWTARTSQISGTGTLMDVAWIPNWNLFVLTGTTSAASWQMISTSPDGATWTARAATPSGASTTSGGIAWDGASTVVISEFGGSTAATQAWSSTNGTTWTRIDINGAAASNNTTITYFGGNYGRFINPNSTRSQTPASVTTAWVSGTNYLSNVNMSQFGTMSSTAIQYKGWKPYFDTTRNYCYQAMLSNSGTSANPVSALVTMDMSATYTTTTASNQVYFPIIKTELLPFAGQNMNSILSYSNQFYAFLNGQHFYVSNYTGGAMLQISSTIVP